jgi:hypothetical protein
MREGDATLRGGMAAIDLTGVDRSTSKIHGGSSGWRNYRGDGYSSIGNMTGDTHYEEIVQAVRHTETAGVT